MDVSSRRATIGSTLHARAGTSTQFDDTAPHTARHARRRRAVLRSIVLVIGSGVVAYLLVRLGAHLLNDLPSRLVGHSGVKVHIPSKPAFTAGLANVIGLVVAAVAMIGMAKAVWGRNTGTTSHS